jgi:hypothetical protein
MRALVTGWFSFEEMGATAGDLMSRDVVCEWLTRAEVAYDVALAHPFTGGVDWASVPPTDYSHLIFVCGPFGRSWEVTQFLERFSHCRKIGMNLSMLESLDAWNPFDLLLERDSSRSARPDLSFVAAGAKVPVVGVVLIDTQPEYAGSAKHGTVNDEIERFVRSADLAAVRIDTRLDVNTTGLHSAAQIESLIARMDAVLTTRMHGLVLSLKNGVPVVAVDSVAGGAKVTRQAQTLGWPYIAAEAVSQETLRAAFESSLTPQGRERARACAERAKVTLESAAEAFRAEFASGTSPGGASLR